MGILYLKILVLIIVYTNYINSEPYKVAVMNYEAEEFRQDAAQDIIIRNAAAYGKHMDNAGDGSVDLIVFPVGGLTTLTPFSGDYYDLYLEYSVDLTNYTENPCNSTYWREPERKAVRDISCSALVNNIYAIVNLLEKEYTNDSNSAEYFLYNTNIVFNKAGDIILRYRKTIPNIGNVAEKDQKNDFSTPFGNFTTMIGDDLLIYPRPTLSSNVTVILTTAQTNLLKPSGIIFYDALRRAEKTHLLVSEHINENNQSCSCVYAPDRMVESECSTNIRPMIHTIKLNSKETSPSVTDLKASSHSYQPTKRESDRQNTKPITITNILGIELSKVNITNIRHSTYNYWCDITLRDEQKSITDTNYCAFQITTSLNNFSKVQLCGVIACNCSTNGTCEYRRKPHNSTLQVSISPKETNHDTKENKYLPITSDYGLRPLERYDFNDTANSVKMSVSDGIDTLIFGLLEMIERTTDKVESRGGTENGRNSSEENKKQVSPSKNMSNESHHRLSMSLVALLVCFFLR